MSNYNPFKFAVAQLSTPEAIAWYRSTALETVYCFCEGVLVLSAAALRAGQLFCEFLYVLYCTILETNQRPHLQLCPAVAPIALLPAQVSQHPDWDRFVRRQVKQAMVESRDWAPVVGETVIVTPAPKKRRGGRRKAATA